MFIDDEWEASGPVELEMAAARALLVVSQEVVMSGVHHPWDLGITVGEVFDHLVAMVPLEVSPTMFDELVAAELALQSIVAGGREDEIRRALDPALSGLAARPDERDRRELNELREVVPWFQARGRQLEAEQVAHLAERQALVDQLAAQAVELRRRTTLTGLAAAGLARARRAFAAWPAGSEHHVSAESHQQPLRISNHYR